MYVLAVAGPRDWQDKDLVYASLDTYLSHHYDMDSLVSGGASGVDTFAKDWAGVHEIPCTEYIARWEMYGKSAGPIRNQQMAVVADRLLAFQYTGKPLTAGTANMALQMDKLGKEVTIISGNI